MRPWFLGWEASSPPGDVSVTGFQANSSYTMSSVFTISGLANVATWGTNSPVNLTGTGINVKNIYLAGSNGQVVDLLHISGGSLATLLSSGTFMLTWQFETNSSFNPSSSVTMDFSDSLLSLAGDYGMVRPGSQGRNAEPGCSGTGHGFPQPFWTGGPADAPPPFPLNLSR